MECLACMVAQAVGYTGKALSTVSGAMRERDPTIVLKTVMPTTQQETSEEVYLEDDVKMISGKWVDAEKTPRVAKARWALRGFEGRAAKDDCYSASASLVAVKLILVWTRWSPGRGYQISLCPWATSRALS